MRVGLAARVRIKVCKKKRKEIKVCKGIAEHLGIAVQAEIAAGEGIALPAGIAVCLRIAVQSEVQSCKYCGVC